LATVDVEVDVIVVVELPSGTVEVMVVVDGIVEVPVVELVEVRMVVELERGTVVVIVVVDALVIVCVTV